MVVIGGVDRFCKIWFQASDRIGGRIVLKRCSYSSGQDGRAPSETATSPASYPPTVTKKEDASNQAAETTPAQEHEHRDWYSRGYLPHFDRPGLIQFVTFRLADSLPVEIANRIEIELRKAKIPITARDAWKQRHIEGYLDAGHGECCLRDARIAQLV